LIINFIGINPVKALVFSAVLNGVAAVPLIFLIIKISVNKKLMGQYHSGMLSKIMLWITFFAMSSAAVVMFYMMGRG
jgi:Mn2+/Fe2+ NRAMP family transporter